MYEYKVIVMSFESISEAEGRLNSFAAEGWRVISISQGNRVLLERAHWDCPATRAVGIPKGQARGIFDSSLTKQQRIATIRR